MEPSVSISKQSTGVTMSIRLVFGLLLAALSPPLLAQVDTSTSAAYQIGQFVGFAFVAVLAIMILRKIFKK